MKNVLMAAVALTAAVPHAAFASPANDAVKAVTTWLDKFNAGDMQAFFAGHAASPVITDEFPPYIWTGKDAPQRWAQSFGADAKAHAITDPHMDHGAPLRADSDGSSAYIVIPTVYHVKESGKPMSAKGSMTFVMTHGDGSWKIASWTYSAPAPTPDR
jgi:ketosteroid isomerase-like protein